ncbi:phosphotransferase enzyme family protein [Moelleriella libera RCEF 2490]|uniref:Phosphotransferase enzyme family protein n=1 Tax=Moelleriella libera RCEF 2490 TaxID=1081109 RepID=A0A162ITY1_9HYPO|nr:phosphotransferase enzyme family protein [Moelleriella libera RCEF 2490]
MGSLPPLFVAPDLPAPLPTTETIAASQDVLQEYTGRRIVRVGDHFVVKYGAAVSLTEGENMLFVKQSSTVPVPTVYAIFSRRDEDKKFPTNYIVMENIAGETLEACWSTLDTQAKADVAGKLRGHLTQLRRIPSPGYFGLLGKRPYDNSVFWTSEEATRQMISGPFDTQQQMVNAMLENHLHRNQTKRKAEFYRRVLPNRLHDQPSVFTHGDVQRKNLLLKEDGTLVVLDWEDAGWYPNFWEYAMTMFSCRWEDDWHDWVVKAMDEYVEEYAWMHMLLGEIWA